MRMVKEYCILEANHGAELTEIVNRHIEEGWQPFGHPFIIKANYEQAMVRYEEPLMVPMYGDQLVEETIKRKGKIQ